MQYCVCFNDLSINYVVAIIGIYLKHKKNIQTFFNKFIIFLFKKNI